MAQIQCGSGGSGGSGGYSSLVCGGGGGTRCDVMSRLTHYCMYPPNCMYIPQNGHTSHRIIQNDDFFVLKFRILRVFSVPKLHIK